MEAQSKQYSLLLQDDLEGSDDIFVDPNERMIILEDEDCDDGFKSMADDDEYLPVDVESHSEESDEEIYNCKQHRLLTNHCRHFDHGQNSTNYELLTKKCQKSRNLTNPLLWTPSPMSPLRRTFFIASIMLGVIVVATFLWALPCDVQPCETTPDLGPTQWFVEIQNVGVNYTARIERIKGPFSLLLSFYAIEKLSMQFSHNNSNECNKKLLCALTQHPFLHPKQCGLISINEENGKEEWRMMLRGCPQHINCNLIDVTGDGIFDCLLTGSRGVTLVIDATNGHIVWHLKMQPREVGHLSEFVPSPSYFGQPILLNDIDMDGFPELLFSCLTFRIETGVGMTVNGNENKENWSQLVLISGKSGMQLGISVSLEHCRQISSMYLEEDAIGYSCLMESGSELTGTLPISNFLNDHGAENATDISLDPIRSNPEINDAICRIKYTNKGKCPHCKVKIELNSFNNDPIIEEYLSAQLVFWKVLSYKNICKGTILKLWEYSKDSYSQVKYVAKERVSDMVTNSSLKTKSNYGKTNSMDEKDFKKIDESLDKPLYTEIPHDDIKIPSERQISLNTTTMSTPFSLNKDHLMNPSNFGNPHFKYPSINTPDNGVYALNRKSINLQASHLRSDNVERDNSTRIPPPVGYRLQKLREVFIAFIFNGTSWNRKELGSMEVYQLCENECFPNHLDQANSVYIDTSSFSTPNWNLYVSSSTYSAESNMNRDNITWTLESYIRKIGLHVD